MKTIGSINEVLSLQSELGMFILESCPWMAGKKGGKEGTTFATFTCFRSPSRFWEGKFCGWRLPCI